MKLISKRNLQEQAEILGAQKRNEYKSTQAIRLQRLFMIASITFAATTCAIFYLYLKNLAAL